jgi:hypothetical protein
MSDSSSHRRPQLILLLEAISSGRTDLALDYFSPKEINWAIQSGLGPLMFRSIQDGNNDSASVAWRSLKASDLTVRVLTSTQFEAMAEIIDACSGRAPILTLLKGASIAEEFYPNAHLRLMRDLDFLVPKEYVPAVEEILRQLGYRQRGEGSPDRFDAYHHTMPFFHEQKHVWVEVHRALFSGMQRASMEPVFHLGNILAELRPSSFQGREVSRLSHELQLVYVACHWAHVFKPIGGAVAMIDAIYLLKSTGDALCWARILDWVNGCAAATYLYLLLSYLDCYGLVKIAPEVMRQLAQSQPSFGKLRLKAAHAIIDRYFMEGQDFGSVLNRRNLDIAWQLLTLPNPFLRKLIVRKVMLRSRRRVRFQ